MIYLNNISMYIIKYNTSNTMNEIIPNLYLSDQRATIKLLPNQIDFIISIGAQSKALSIAYIHFGIKDNPNINILKELSSITALIDKSLNDGKKVLVHCKAGINRSPSFILAYLCKYRAMTITEGIKLILSKRKCCRFSLQNQVELWLSTNCK